MMTMLLTSALVLAAGTHAVRAQSDTAWSDQLPPLLDEAWEIALARSAAPAQVTDDATVLVLQRGGYVVAVEGTNGVTCYLSRSRPESLEPHCFDAEGSATILAMALRRAELRELGKTKAEADADIAEGLAAGRFRLPTRPAMSYMMSSGQVLFDDDGTRVGNWRPHLMIYVPYITSADIGVSGPPSLAAPIVVDAGKPTANIMVVVAEFVEPKGGR